MFNILTKIFSSVLLIVLLYSTAIANNYNTIENNLKDRTSFQQTTYVSSLQNTDFEDLLKVVDVNDLFVMTRKPRFLLPYSGTYVYIFDMPTDLKLLLNKGQYISVKGTIKKISIVSPPTVDIYYISSDIENNKKNKLTFKVTQTKKEKIK